MSQPFVGIRTVASAGELRSLIDQVAQKQPYYSFLRWPHQVSGLAAGLPETFPSPEGQVFSQFFELRWQQLPVGYEVLLLHCNEVSPDSNFTAVGETWQVSSLKGAYLYERDETRFPKGLQYPKGLQFRQRYFHDTQTATVHFVALTPIH